MSDMIHPDDHRFQTPTIEMGVQGPRNSPGLLLRAPRTEALVWDLEMEVATVRRAWLPDREGWWIDSSYRETVIAVVLRSFPSVLVLEDHEDRLYSRDGSADLQGRLL